MASKLFEVDKFNVNAFGTQFYAIWQLDQLLSTGFIERLPFEVMLGDHLRKTDSIAAAAVKIGVSMRVCVFLFSTNLTKKAPETFK